jgi:hypothetical protein
MRKTQLIVPTSLLVWITVAFLVRGIIAFVPGGAYDFRSRCSGLVSSATGDIWDRERLMGYASKEGIGESQAQSNTNSGIWRGIF